MAHYVCLKCGQHDLTADASREHSEEQHHVWFTSLPRGESSYKLDKTKPSTYFKAARKASEDDSINPTKRKRTEPKPVVTPKQDVSRAIANALAISSSSRPVALATLSSKPYTLATSSSSRPYALATSSLRPDALATFSSRPYALATSSSRPDVLTTSSSRPDALATLSSRPYALATSSSKLDASRAVDTLSSPRCRSACFTAPSSTMTPLSVYLPSDQAKVNENADFNEIEQLSISTDSEQEDQLDSTNKSFNVNSNDYVIDWKKLYFQSCQIIQCLETVNNSLNNAIMHYTR